MGGLVSFRPVRRRLMAAAAGLLLLGGLPLLGSPASATVSPAFQTPAYNGDFPDPSVTLAGGRYWAYATGSAGTNLQVMSSPDLRTWSPPADPLPVLPKWATGGHTWAPAVVSAGGAFIMYYTVRDTLLDRQCISVAVSAVPAGPFVDASTGPLICQADHGGSIDPNPYLDPVSGHTYLIWKSDDNVIGQPTHIWAQPLATGGLSLAGGSAPSLLLTDSAPWQGSVIEGPTIVRHWSTYYLFYGGNNYNTAASAIGYATSASLLGPYRNQSVSSPWFASTGGATGPQGPMVFTDQNGATRMAFAAWSGAVGYQNSGSRALWFGYLQFDRAGSPSLATTPPVQGYWFTAADGGVFAFNAPFYGSTGNVRLNRPVVGMDATPSGHGYWLVAADGGIFSFGDARFQGSTGGITLNQPIVGMAADPVTGGYWFVAADGGVFAFNAPFYGSVGNVRLNQPIVGMASTPSGHGYWLVARDGGVFGFGDARFYGSTGGIRLNQPIVGMAADPVTGGYWFVAADGGVFAFNSPFYGSVGNVRLNQPIVAMASSPSGFGYWLVARDGGVFSFGDAGFHGSTGGIRLAQPIVGTATP